LTSAISKNCCYFTKKKTNTISFLIPEQKLKKRWKHLKDQYRKELKKVTQKGLPEDVVPWQYYEALSFLKEDVVKRERERFFLTPNSEEEASEDDKIAPRQKLVATEPRQPKKIKAPKKVGDPTSKLGTILRRVVETKALLVDRLNVMDDMQRNDPDYLYLMSILPSMKQLTEIQKLHFKSKVSDWMLQVITSNAYGAPGDADTYILAEVKAEMAD
jgi:hypothetical protein